MSERNAAGLKPDTKRRNTILFISHEASPTGAPRVLLNIMRWLRTHTDFGLRLILRSGGALEREFREIAEVHLESSGWNDGLIRDVCVIYSNTGTNGLYLQTLPVSDLPIITHLHELNQVLESCGEENSAAILAHTTEFIACSPAVKSMLEKNYRVDPDIVSVIPEAIVPDEVRQRAQTRAAREVRRELGIGDDGFLVVGCGSAEVRKGTDLFILLARECVRRDKVGKITMIWVGPFGNALANSYYIQDIKKLGLAGRVRFLGPMDNPHPILAACDLFCLPSREDPFPLVMLESGALGKPTVAFSGSGGAEEYCRRGGGYLVPYLDVQGMAECIADIMANRSDLKSAGHKARLLVEQEFNMEVTGPAIESIIRRVAVDESTVAGRAQIFVPCQEGYSEAHSICRPVKAREWHRLQFHFSAVGGSGPWNLRFDPLDKIAVIEIAAIELKRKYDGTVLWAANNAQDLSAITVSGTAIRLPDTERFTLINLGLDPILYLPRIEILPERADYQLEVVLWADCEEREFGRASQTVIHAYNQWTELSRKAAGIQVNAGTGDQVSLLYQVIAAADGRELYVWGTGSAGKEIGEILQRCSQPFNAFIDPDPDKCGRSVLDHPIMSPQRLTEIRRDSFVIIGSQFHMEIATRLNCMGFMPGRDYATPAWLK